MVMKYICFISLTLKCEMNRKKCTGSGSREKTLIQSICALSFGVVMFIRLLEAHFFHDSQQARFGYLQLLAGNSGRLFIVRQILPHLFNLLV